MDSPLACLGEVGTNVFTASWLIGAIRGKNYHAATAIGRTSRKASSSIADEVLSHLTEGSILDSPQLENFVPFAVGGRKRRATCSSVAWFPDHHVAVVNLYGGHLRIYRFHPGGGRRAEECRLELLHEIKDGMDVPEDVAVSPDCKLLAVAHSLSETCGITLYSINQSSSGPELAPIKLRTGGTGEVFHSVDFSPDSRFISDSPRSPTLVTSRSCVWTYPPNNARALSKTGLRR